MDCYEFFAGGGMARAGLGPAWRCLFANDNDPKKAESYRRNFNGGNELKVCSVESVDIKDLPGKADLAWASFPCQDLSQAGAQEGFNGRRSAVFWPFMKLMSRLGGKGRAPRIITLENVYGTITSRGGKDFASILEALASAGYRPAPLLVDAAMFLPQSRPRLFIIAYGKDCPPPAGLVREEGARPWRPDSFLPVYNQLSKKAKGAWVWVNPPPPKGKVKDLSSLVEKKVEDSFYHSPERTKRLLSMMAGRHLDKVRSAGASGGVSYGTGFCRIRRNGAGERVQRTEVRFDGLAGCLRTPAGGSSRQILFRVEGDKVTTRLFTPREAARLMGLPDSYALPESDTEAYRLTGDGVAPPVVSWLARTLIEPALEKTK